jgi:hypothetical protein
MFAQTELRRRCSTCAFKSSPPRRVNQHTRWSGCASSSSTLPRSANRVSAVIELGHVDPLSSN